jgi:hypothetical protein
MPEKDSLHSTLRERIVEHAFVGDALRLLWRNGVVDVEVLRSEFDAHGYDLVMTQGRVPLVSLVLRDLGVAISAVSDFTGLP